MRIATMCPKCGSVLGYEENMKDGDNDFCQFCNTKRIRVDVDGEWLYNIPTDLFDEDEEEICRKFLYKLPTFDEKAYEYRHKRYKAEDEELREIEAEIERQSSNQPHCPICNSTNIHKISALNKVASVGLFGVFAAGHVSKTFKCDNCGAKF